MVATMVLLGVVYAAFIAAAIVAGAGPGVVVVVAAALSLVQLFLADKVALAALGAREVSPAQAPDLHAIVERLCIQADLPKPRVALVASPTPNAFALGRSQKAATVCATTGLMRMLSPVELEAVVGHELTHVANRDVIVMTIASFFASIAALLARFGLFFGGGRRNSQGQLFVFVFLVSLAVWLISFVLLRMLSRYREFAADRGSALLTGRPSALSSALLKLTESATQIPRRDLRRAGQMSAFFIVPTRSESSVRNLLATHPPLEKRLAALSRLEEELHRRP